MAHTRPILAHAAARHASEDHTTVLQEVEPHNEAAQRKIMWAQEARSKGQRTVPSTLADEMTFNPIFECFNHPAPLPMVELGIRLSYR